MFVCNKVDTSAGAEQFDTRSSDELDSDEDETTTKFDKGRIAFSQLQEHGLIAETETYNNCSCFYGISAQNVREDRRKKRSSKATEAFSKFEGGLLAALDETVKLQSKEAVGKLILLQMNVVHAMGRTRCKLPKALFGTSLEFDTAKSIGKSLHETLISAIANERKIGMLINCNFLDFKERFMFVAEQYQYHHRGRSSELELEARVSYLLLVNEHQSKDQLTFTPRKEDAPLLHFLVVMKGLILDWTFNVLKRVVQKFLKRTTDHVEIHSRRIVNPVLGYAFAVAYGSLSPLKTQTAVSKTGVDVLSLLKIVVSKVLRKILTELLIDGLLHAIESTSSSDDFNVTDKQSKTKIIEFIFSKFNRDVITESLCVSCTKCLNSVHDAFFKVIHDLSRVNELVSTSTSQQLQEMTTVYVPIVRNLVIRGLALQFLLTKGPLMLGQVLKPTKHCKIHECSGWADEGYKGACVVKVIEKKKVDAEVWAQTSVDLFNVM